MILNVRVKKYCLKRRDIKELELDMISGNPQNYNIPFSQLLFYALVVMT